MFAANGAAGASGNGCEAGVGGEVAGGGEVLAGDFGEESGGGPDPDSWHADQDGVKRVSLHGSFNLDCDLVALASERGELFGEFGEHDAGRVGAGDYDRLLTQRLGDFVGETAAHPRCQLDEPAAEAGRADGLHQS